MKKLLPYITFFMGFGAGVGFSVAYVVGQLRAELLKQLNQANEEEDEEDR